MKILLIGGVFIERNLLSPIARRLLSTLYIPNEQSVARV